MNKRQFESTIDSLVENYETSRAGAILSACRRSREDFVGGQLDSDDVRLVKMAAADYACFGVIPEWVAVSKKTRGRQTKVTLAHRKN